MSKIIIITENQKKFLQGREFSINSMTINENLKRHPFIVKEGLIRSYPIDKVLTHIRKSFNLSSSFDDYNNIAQSNSDYYGIALKSKGDNNTFGINLILPFNKQNINRILERLNCFGYFKSSQDDLDENGFITIYVEKKFDDNVSQIIKGLKYIYHLCPQCVVEKIKKQGLVPKFSQWSDFENAERVYFFLSYPNQEVRKNWQEEFANKNVHNNKKYILLRIDTSKLNNVKFYSDPRADNAVYTYENINPNAIEIIN